MRKIYFCYLPVVLLLLTTGCTSYKAKQQTALTTLPKLGSIVKVKNNILYKSAEQVGIPQWTHPIKISVKETAFNSISYDRYSLHAKKSGLLKSVVDMDSLPIKPIYLQIKLLNKIALTELLNAENNNNIRLYLANDENYKIVTALDAVVSPNMLTKIIASDMIILEQNEFQNIQLVAINGKQKTFLDEKQFQIFGYSTGSFCWGEDQYHNKRIRIIRKDGEGCPKGTYRKARKIKTDKSYLKL